MYRILDYVVFFLNEFAAFFLAGFLYYFERDENPIGQEGQPALPPL